jgi:hypothetical protein
VAASLAAKVFTALSLMAWAALILAGLVTAEVTRRRIGRQGGQEIETV